VSVHRVVFLSLSFSPSLGSADVSAWERERERGKEREKGSHGATGKSGRGT